MSDYHGRPCPHWWVNFDGKKMYCKFCGDERPVEGSDDAD